ncbi:MAG: hypothetical protein HYU66_19900 [Armatimonadetes bacterium]|nr:hypothetical protein [Armatimonadota bacterium]
MCERRDDLEARILEDDGLVAGLSPEAAAVVRGWCRQRAFEALAALGPEQAVRQTDRSITTARQLTEAVVELQAGESRRWVLSRLNRICPDGEAALRILAEPRPIEDRLSDLLSRMS